MSSSSDALPPPTGIDIYKSQVPGILAAHIVTYVAAVLAVALRAASKRISQNTYSWDDFFIVLALAFSTAWLLIAASYTIPHGLGKHIWVAGDNADESVTKGVFFEELTYVFTVYFAKTSLLALYWRIFNEDRRIRPWIYLIAFILIAYTLAGAFLIVFQCKPPQALWEIMSSKQMSEHVPSGCSVVKSGELILAGGVNILTDIALIILPIPFIWKLQMPTPQKLALIGVFAFSFFVTAVSIGRVVILVRTNYNLLDWTWNVARGVTLSDIEMNTSIICACLPCLRAVLGKIFPCLSRSRGCGGLSRAFRSQRTIFGLRSSNTISCSHIERPKNARVQSKGPFEMDDMQNGFESLSTTESGRRTPPTLQSAIKGGSLPTTAVKRPSPVIHVQRDIDIIQSCEES